MPELPSRLSVCSCKLLSGSELGSSVDAVEHIDFFVGGLNCSNVDVEEADGVVLKILAFELVAFAIRQAREAMTMQLPVQR